MSAELELLHNLPKIKVAPIKIPSRIEATAEGRGGGGEEECRTPTSEENKIPATLNCPPAPRKPARRTASCKRKLAELGFFEIANRRELDDFFRSSFDIVAKRKCPCT